MTTESIAVPASLSNMKHQLTSDETLLSTIETLRAKCADYERRLADQQEALVDLSLARNEEFIMLYSLLEFSKSIGSSSDRNSMLDSAIRLLGNTFGLTYVAVFEWSRGSASLPLIASSLHISQSYDEVTLEADDPIAKPVMQSAQVCLVDNLADSRFCRQFVPQMTAALCAPMLSRGQLCGVIVAFGAHQSSFADRHYQIMSAVGAYLAVGIESSDLHLQMQKQALTDELTGLLNRRALDDRLQEEIARAQRYRDSLCLLMIDVDHFKQLNDRYGHDAGDIVLKHVARLMQQTVRFNDICARYGGEEFAVILPQTDVELASIVAERVRVEIADLGRTPLALLGGASPRAVTISIGVAGMHPGTDETMRTLLHRADQALYQAKTEGRNRVCLSRPMAVLSSMERE